VRRDIYDASLETHQRQLRESFTFRPDVDNDAHISALRASFDNGQLCLVLGAGCSAPYRIPTWANLVRDLASDIFGTDLDSLPGASKAVSSLSLLSFARILNAHSFLDSYFYLKIRELLYKSYDPLASNPTYEEIAALLHFGAIEEKAARCPDANVSAIISYNFDNLLELQFEKLMLDGCFHSVFDEGSYKIGGPGTSIYHPHGFIPLSIDDASAGGPLVFSEDHYHRMYFDSHHWANQIQHMHFERDTCLFIGLSFSDPNLRRMLDLARSRSNDPRTHYAILKRSNSGIKPDDDFADYMHEKDLGTFPIRVIWVDDFVEIATVLSKLRAE